MKKDQGVEYNPRIEVAHTLQMLSFVTENLGIGCTEMMSCEKDIAENRVIRICLEEELPKRYITLADDPDREMKSTASAFKKMLYESIKNRLSG